MIHVIGDRYNSIKKKGNSKRETFYEELYIKYVETSKRNFFYINFLNPFLF